MILSPWWSGFYFLPFFKTLLKYFGISLLGDILLTRIDFYFSYWIYLLSLWAFSKKFSNESFRSNLEFHKMGINFKNLRKLFVFDFIISSLLWFVFFIVSVFFSKALGGFFSTDRANVFFNLSIGERILFSLYVFTILSWTSFISKDPRYLFFSIKSKTPLKKFFYLLVFWTMGVMVIFLAGFFGINADLINLWALSTLALASILFHLKAYFHQGIFRSTILHCLGYSFCSALILFFMYFLTFKIEGEKIHLVHFDLSKRIRLYDFYLPLVTKIELENFRQLEPELDYLDKYYLYKKIDFDPNQLGLSFFIDSSKNQSRLVSFLAFGKPNKEFLSQLFKHIETNKNFWDGKTYKERVLQLSFLKWPKNEKMTIEGVSLKKEFKNEKQGDRLPANLSR